LATSATSAPAISARPTFCVLIAHAFGASHGIAILAGLAGGLGAFLGHIFPVWLGFRGGKGVATYIGILFGLFWPAGLTFCVAWLLAAVLTRISSLSAIAASLIVPPVLYYLDNVPEAGLALIMTALLIVKHAANIRRLLKGEEPKIGDNKTAPAKGPLNA
jgi:acyl phosphate:glycerol-3-phosphate acyltransferase